MILQTHKMHIWRAHVSWVEDADFFPHLLAWRVAKHWLRVMTTWWSEGVDYVKDYDMYKLFILGRRNVVLYFNGM